MCNLLFVVDVYTINNKGKAHSKNHVKGRKRTFNGILLKVTGVDYFLGNLLNSEYFL